MRILITGAGGNIGKGIVPRLRAAGHDLVLSDLGKLPETPELADLPFFQCDVQNGFGLEKAADGCDLILHTPAWHGIHWGAKTEIDFWRLNVDGTFWAFQAAKANNIKRFVFLSSQAWHGHYNKYGFTKRVGEELCEYHRQTNGVRYVAIRPADLTPWGDNWPAHYGARLLYGGVDREDVLDSIALGIERLAGNLPDESEPEGIVVDATRPNVIPHDLLEQWESDPIGVCEKVFPGAGTVIDRYGLDTKRRPSVSGTTGWEEVGYAPSRHFGTFLEELQRIEAEGREAAVRKIRCSY